MRLDATNTTVFNVFSIYLLHEIVCKNVQNYLHWYLWMTVEYSYSPNYFPG